MEKSKRFKDWSKKLLKEQTPIIEIPNEEIENTERKNKNREKNNIRFLFWRRRRRPDSLFLIEK